MIQNISRRALLLAAGVSVGALVAGCGGGSSPLGGGKSPSRATKTKVKDLHSRIFSGALMYGCVSLGGVGFGLVGGGGFGGAPTPAYGGAEDTSAGGGTGAGGSAPGGSNNSSGNAAPAVPMLGAFLKNVASVPPTTRAVRIHTATRKVTRQQIAPGEPYPDKPNPDDPSMPPIWEQPSFYFDYYLGLWVQITETSTQSRYDLFIDEAKTQGAGEIVTEHPDNWDTFPQVYSSHYTFEAGFLAGSHGSSQNTTNADYSGRSSYTNVYSDGGKDTGSSNWSSRGDSSWTSRTDAADGSWNTSAGTFRSDGSGGTREAASDGYAANYTYNSDGSGRGTITGPDDGLPVSVSWDAYGNVTIRYADGSIETFNRWGIYPGPYYGDDPTPIAVDGTMTGGTGSGGGSGPTETPPPAPKL